MIDTLATSLVLHPDCGRHDTGWSHPEHMGRLPAIVQALYRDTIALLGSVLQQEGRHATEAELLRAHAAGLIASVRTAAESAVATGEAVAIDNETIVSAASWDAARAAAGCAIEAVDIVMQQRARTAFALCRPPGHHATHDRAMGFCLFNNVAVAARAAQAQYGIERVLVIDWDVHHGNGTQDIFYSDPGVFYLSLHLDGHYPGTGSAAETGAGAGAGATLNVPLPAGIDGAEYRRHFDEAVERAFAHNRPQLVLVSAGYDCLAGDPLGGMLLEPHDLHEMTKTVLRHAQEDAAGRVVALLEGGYVPPRVGTGVVATLRALAGVDY